MFWLCIFLSLSKLEYGRYRFIEVNFSFDVFVGISDTIQCPKKMTEINESSHAHCRKLLTTAWMIALQVVRTSFGFHLRECMRICSTPHPLNLTQRVFLAHKKRIQIFHSYTGLLNISVHWVMSIEGYVPVGNSFVQTYSWCNFVASCRGWWRR